QTQKTIAKLILKNQNYQQIIKQKDQQLKSKRIKTNRNKARLLNKQQTEINNHNCSCPKVCCANGDYVTIKQERDNYQQQINDHKCPSVDNKDKQISALEKEIQILKDKPPVVDSSEVERLLGVIEEKEKVIRELEVKLAAAKPQILEVESGEVKELRNELVRQERGIKRLH
ncbi:8215_t:CDS:2, partial [Racocetra persica]